MEHTFSCGTCTQCNVDLQEIEHWDETPCPGPKDKDQQRCECTVFCYGIRGQTPGCVA